MSHASDRCQKCHHARCFHRTGTGQGVPWGKPYCDDRHGPECDCDGFVEVSVLAPPRPCADCETMRASVMHYGQRMETLARDLEATRDRLRIAEAVRDDARRECQRLLDEVRKLRANVGNERA